MPRSSPRCARTPRATEAALRTLRGPLANDRKPLQLNAVAQAAGVGVGTVYRHFPTPQALSEALAVDQFTVLIRKAAAAPPTQQGLRNFLKAALTVYLRDDAFAAAITDPNPVTADS
jgi:AcrR family transcriptional regulator